MNCKHVQELLPLYVGRDLEAKRAQMIAAHVQSCAQCAGSCDEYRETRRLLQEFAPPSFDEAVYSGIRRRVLREIEREATPSLPNFIANLFRPRLRWAVATALLLAVSIFAFYFIANRRNDGRDSQQVAGSGRTVERPTSIKESKGPTPASPVNNRDPVEGLSGGTRRPQRKRTAGAPDRTNPGTVNSTDPRSMSAQTLPDGRSEPDAAPARNAATTEKTLRVEMQTKDPNIRIIWFTAQPTKQDSPNKSSKGT